MQIEGAGRRGLRPVAARYPDASFVSRFVYEMGNIATPRETHEIIPLLEPLLQQHDDPAGRQEKTLMPASPLVS